MSRSFLIAFSLFSLTLSSLFAGCSQSVEVNVGWRRDSLDWKLKHLDSSYVSADVDSRIHFKDINSYMINGKARWVGSNYYVRFTAEYGSSYKGRAHEDFKIDSPYLPHTVRVHTSDPVKRRSEVYDFNLAVGYPFCFFCSRLNVIPLIGFSFHRQHLRVKEDRQDSYYSYNNSYCPYYYFSDYYYSYQSNPFSSRSDPNIASELGYYTHHRTDNYRFTWYGFYLGTDIAFAVDSCWSLYGQFEFHFLDNCHRKRKSWTSVYFVDDYHKKGWAYGFIGEVGLTYAFSTCWYTNISVDLDWWKGHSKHDELHWKKVGAKIGLGYMF